eukprot:scaffold964_cov261-Pinguiococcus_pyrenoidosus.AAC.16
MTTPSTGPTRAIASPHESPSLNAVHLRFQRKCVHRFAARVGGVPSVFSSPADAWADPSVCVINACGAFRFLLMLPLATPSLNRGLIARTPVPRRRIVIDRNYRALLPACTLQLFQRFLFPRLPGGLAPSGSPLKCFTTQLLHHSKHEQLQNRWQSKRSASSPAA